MATGLRDREDQDSRIDNRYSQGAGSYNPNQLDSLEQAYNQPAIDDTKRNASEDLKNLEDSYNSPAIADADRNNGITNNVTKPSGKSQKLSFKARAKQFIKKRGPLAGILGGLGIGGLTLFGFFGPASLIINLYENITEVNDTSSPTMSRRFMKVFGHATEDPNANSDGDICKSQRMKCRFTRLSNSAIRELNKKGIVAVDADGNDMEIRKTGYPDKNPAQYRIGDDVIDAANMREYLLRPENSAKLRQIHGVSGAFNMKSRAWYGKHISSRFYSVFGISRNGGIADGNHKRDGTARERYNAVMEKLRAKIPVLDTSSASTKITDKVKANQGKAGKGGAAYAVTVAGCIGLKAPSYIAMGAAGIQMLQIAPIVMEVVLSPGSKAKAAGFDSGFTSEDMSAAGDILTTETENADGKMTSALDSSILLAAMGANTARTGVSSFAPGYSIVTNPTLSAVDDVSEDTEKACNVIMSPAAMYSAMAVSSAVTVAASSTIILGVVKLAADYVISEIAEKFITKLISDYGEDILMEVASNDRIPEAEGEEMGDVIGTSAMAFFSGGAQSRFIPGLTESQVSEFAAIKQEVENKERADTFATLSPFDTSSKYTFLGSIVHNMRTAMLVNGVYQNPVMPAVFSTLSSLSLANFMPQTSAVAAAEQCTYAEEFGLDTGSEDTTAAINAAGLPCTGLSAEMDSISTEEAVDLMYQEGWINKDVEFPEDASLSELLELPDKQKVFKDDTPLTDYIELCGDASTGQYLIEANGCTFSNPASNMGIDCSEQLQSECSDEQIEGQGVSADSEIDDIDPRALSAIPVFLIDYQILQSMNGHDEEEAGSSASSDSATGTVDGTAQELAQQLLDNPDVSYWDQSRDAGDKSRPSDNLRSIAAGEPANTSTRGRAGGASTPIDENLLKFLVELSQATSFQINALAGQKHMENSLHYQGKAVDFQCGADLPKTADAIAAKYGVERNRENCAEDHHWHYQVVGN